MNIKLIDKPVKGVNPKAQICLNRGIKPDNIKDYLCGGYGHINPPTAFDSALLEAAARKLIKTISRNGKICIIVDSDTDGLTSSAILINYLYTVFPSYTSKYVEWMLHEGKQHGLKDVIDTLLDCSFDLVICPDSATNDIEEIEKLHNIMTEVIILDHHLSDVPISEFAITINSQYNYPNKFLSGAGVVWQFCRYLDSRLGKNFADEFLDLAAIGNQADMMDIRELETKELIFKGLQEEYIKNPLIYGLSQKNAFALSKADYVPSMNNNLQITPMGASFFIVPLLNAICRSGTMEEKNLIFDSMLLMKAFIEIPSNKRGHKPGDMERVLDQALRTCTNVKNRQTRAEDAGMALLTAKAEEMLNDKVLFFVLEEGEIDPNIAGLVANKLASKYQRPVCVTRHINIPIDENDEEREASNGWDCMGSMRGYTATGIDNFKAVAESSSSCNWCRGHENAAGISVTDPNTFINDMNETLKDISTDIVYYVDYMWDADNVSGEAIIDLAEMNDYLGTGFARPLVYVHDCVIEDYMLMKDAHLKINIPNCSVIMWNIDDELKERIQNGEKITINFVGRCNVNEWNWERNPQLIIEDWEEIETTSVTPAAAWGF